MTPFWSDDHLSIYLGDVRAVLDGMEPESVGCVVTSPPYFSLRDYGIPPVVWGGDAGHEHEWTETAVRVAGGTYKGKDRWQHQANGRGEDQPGERRQHLTGRIDGHPEVPAGTYCPCGAWLGSLGLEPTPVEYVAHMVDVFRSVRRVLRKDGTLWLNLGDSYAAGGGSRTYGSSDDATGRGDAPGGNRAAPAGMKAKDRMMIPARVAIALQEDGWWLRDEIVWAKPNPMPSSVGDRTTPAHEMVYLLSKSARYHYDAKAICEPTLWPDGPNSPQSIASPYGQGFTRKASAKRQSASALSFDRETKEADVPGQSAKQHRIGRERNVGGREDGFTRMPGGAAMEGVTWGQNGTRNKRSVWTVATQPYPEAHFATFPEKLIEPMILAGCRAGDTVLDPFGGSGTVAVVAQRFDRRAVLIDLSDEYVGQMIRRIAKARAEGEGPAVDMPVPPSPDGLWGLVG